MICWVDVNWPGRVFVCDSLLYMGLCCSESEAPLYIYITFFCTGGSVLLRARSRGSTPCLASASREISPERHGGSCRLLFHLCVSEGHVTCMTGLQPRRRAQRHWKVISFRHHWHRVSSKSLSAAKKTCSRLQRKIDVYESREHFWQLRLIFN